MRGAASTFALVPVLYMKFVVGLPWHSGSIQMQGVMRRDCEPWPSHPDNSTLDTIYAIAVARNVTPKVLLATFETAWVESRVWPLDCGDQDSVGAFQQRPSQGWGSVEECTNTTYATNAFLDVAIPKDLKNPNFTAGELAQSVQISDFPGRYDLAQDIALDLIDRARVHAENATATVLSQTKASTAGVKVSIATTLEAAPTIQLPVGTITRGCQAYARGSSCVSLLSEWSMTVAQLRFWNPLIDEDCSNVEESQFYCVKSHTVPPPEDIADKTIRQGCTSYVSLRKGMTCESLIGKYGLSQVGLFVLNPGINSDCTNLDEERSYCVAQT